MENRVISFSKDSGIIGEDRTLTLSKSENAKNYEIRYTTDEVFEKDIRKLRETTSVE